MTIEKFAELPRDVPSLGYGGLFFDPADKKFKQIDDAGIISPLAGSAALATGQEFFDKSTTTAATPAQIASDVRIQNYSVKGNTGALIEALLAGDSYNVMNSMLEANESTAGLKPAYYDIANAPQATYLDEANGKFLFPSNINTYNTNYTSFDIRVIAEVDHPAVGSNQSTSAVVRLRRAVDDSIVSSKEFSISNKAAKTDFPITIEFLTFVGGETDPYVLDGMYIDIQNEIDSSTAIILKLCDLRVFKY